MTKFSRAIRPIVDITIPFAGEDRFQTKTIRSLALFVRPIPRGPEDQGERAVTPDHAQIGCGETLFTPVAGGSDDRLVLGDHFLELLDRFECDGILRFAEIDIGASVNAVFRQDYFHRFVRRRGWRRSAVPFLAA